MLTGPFNALPLIPFRQRLPVAAACIFYGSLVATDANGNAAPATDTAGLKVQGISESGSQFARGDQMVDNTSGAAGARAVEVSSGIFRLRNSTAAPLTNADLGKLAVVEDENTAAHTSTHRVAAGVVLAVEPGYAWLWIMPPAGYPSAAFQTLDISLPVP